MNVQSQVKLYGESHRGKNEFIIETYQKTSDVVYLVIAIVILESVEVLRMHTKKKLKTRWN